MGLFKNKAEKQLDEIIKRLQMNMSNNYKDNAQDNLKELESMIRDYTANRSIKGKKADKYSQLLNEYKSQMTGFTHKDQKPYWH